MALSTKAEILAELDNIENRLVSGAFVTGSEQVGVYAFRNFRDTTLDVGEAVLDLLAPSATVTALLARIAGYRVNKVSDVFVRGVEFEAPINRRSFRDEILGLLTDIAAAQGNGAVIADVDTVRTAIEQKKVSQPRTRNEPVAAARPAPYVEFRDSTLDLLTTITNALP